MKSTVFRISLGFLAYWTEVLPIRKVVGTASVVCPTSTETLILAKL